MPPPDSESSIPLPGVYQQSFRSTPPPYSSLEEMDNPNPTHKSDPTGTNPHQPIKRADSGETERPQSAQRVNVDANAQLNSSDDGEESEEEPDPAEQIEGFDWKELHDQYQQAIATASGEEAELMREWAKLMDVCCLFPL
jgi:hypothetical protein